MTQTLTCRKISENLPASFSFHTAGNLSSQAIPMQPSLEDFFDGYDCSDCEQSDDESEHESHQWSYLNVAQMEDFSIATTAVDGVLLQTAVPEIKAICKNVRNLFGVNKNEDVQFNDVTNYFLSSILDHLYAAICDGLPTGNVTITIVQFTYSSSGDSVAESDVVCFCKVLGYLSIYRTTPTRFFDKKKSGLYPMAAVFKKSSFDKIFQSLKKKRDSTCSGTWDAPFTVDRSVREIEQAFTVASCKIAYIRGVTSISLDDDQYRITSSLSESLGFKRINNPKKVFGVVSSNAVSLTSSIVLGLRLMGKGESLQDIVQILLMWMQSSGLPHHVQGMNETIAMDRGYFSPCLIEYLCQQGFHLIGTFRRWKSAPFTFGTFSAANSQRILEKGAKSLYVARRKFGERWVYAVAYRGGRGRVALLLSTMPRISVWVHRPKRSGTFEFSDPGHDLIQSTIDSFTDPLTQSQGGMEWHILRIGLITSTVAHTVLSTCVNTFDTPAEKNMLAIMGISGRSHIVCFDREELVKKSANELKTLCKARRLFCSGNKQELIERLLDPVDPVPIELTADLMKNWFMKPLKTPEMKMGSANETNIRNSIPSFLEKYGQGFSIIGDIVQRGLLRKKQSMDDTNMNLLATSIDGVMVLLGPDKDVESAFVCVLEMKTMTTDHTSSEAQRHLQDAWRQLGVPDQRFFVTTVDRPLFKKLIFKSIFRSQVLHHLTVTGVDHLLFVVASTTNVIFSVLVQVTQSTRDLFESMISSRCAEYLQYFNLPDLFSRINLRSDEFGHAVDCHTVQIWRNLQISMEKWRLDKGHSILPAQDIIPFIVSHWNNFKGGQDVVSRILKNVKVDFRSLTPRGFIFIRFIMLALMNSHMIFRLLKVDNELSSYSQYHQLKQRLNRMASFSDFLQHFVENWTPSRSFSNSPNDPVDKASLPNSEAENNAIPKAPPRYVLKWLNGPVGRQTRLRKDIFHARISTATKRHCPICDSQTTAHCTICGVNACVQLASNWQKTCMDLIHSADRLTDRTRPKRGPGASGRRGRRNQSLTPQAARKGRRRPENLSFDDFSEQPQSRHRQNNE